MQALSRGLAGFAHGPLAGRLWVGHPLVQMPGLVLLTVAEGLLRFGLLQLFHYPARLSELFVHVILPQALYNGFVGAACVVAVEAGAGCCAGGIRGPGPRIHSADGRRGAAASSASPAWPLSPSSGCSASSGTCRCSKAAKLQEMSEKNRIRIRPVAAPRGILFDRNGLALVDNRPAFTLSLIPRGDG